jgi:hypothetical protein
MQRIGALETFVTLSWNALDLFSSSEADSQHAELAGIRLGLEARLSHSRP